MAQIIMAERAAAPDTPATGKVAIYVRDGAYYTKNAAGVETALQGATGPAGADGADGADGIDGTDLLGNPTTDGMVLSSTVAGVRSWVTVSGGIDTISYDNRGTLRSLESGTKIVDGLGLFRWESGSTEPDDDESCFATTNGRWLLEAAHWDVVDSWQLPDNEVRDIQLESHEDRLQYQEARILYGTAVSNITSLSANTQTSFTGIIVGATTADRVIVIPPNKLTMNTSFFARVTEDNTVTVYLNNPSSSSATLVAGIFLIALIKEIV